MEIDEKTNFEDLLYGPIKAINDLQYNPTDARERVSFVREVMKVIDKYNFLVNMYFGE